MDKYEYKIRSEEIRTLIAKGEYAEAAEIADMIDWRRVKSVMMLCTISDLYKINRRFEESKELLLLAYDRHPGGRTIVYSLCELSIKMGEFVQAIEYYKEFVQIAPKDTGRYVLQYKLYVAQEVSLEERIEVLEEFKKRDYREKWAYELAYLYHRVGLGTRCVEECDELILWFGEGKYVTKAMDLKMLHQPLSPEQQAKYEGRFDEYMREQEALQNTAAQNAYGLPADEDNPIDVMTAPTVELPGGELDDIHVKTMDVGEYNTINLQKELADSMKDLWETAPENRQMPVQTEEYFSTETGELAYPEEEYPQEEPQDYEAEEVYSETEVYEYLPEDEEPIQEETSNEEQMIEEPEADETSGDEEENNDTSVVDLTDTQKITQSIVAPLLQNTEDMTEVALQVEDETSRQVMSAMRQEAEASREAQPALKEQAKAEEVQLAGKEPEEAKPIKKEAEPVQEPSSKRKQSYDKVLGMEYDGQISFVLPEFEKVEKQITGQIKLDDILAEWERMKKESEKQCAEEVRQLVLQHTGNILVDFDQAVKDGLLEQLESSEAMDTETSEDVLETSVESREEEPDEDVGKEAEELEESFEATEDETYGVEETPELVIFDQQTQMEESLEEDTEPAELPEELDTQAEVTETSGQTEAPEENTDMTNASEKARASINKSPEMTEASKQSVKIAENVENAKGKESKKAASRPLTKEEKELYAAFLQSRKAKDELVNAIDSISLAPYTGNVIITGEEGMDTLTLAKNMLKEVQMTDSNFSGKIAKVSGSSMNQRDLDKITGKLSNGALIIENAGKMNPETGQRLYKALQQENNGIIVIMEGSKKSIGKLLEQVPSLNDCFNGRVNIEALNNDALVAFGKKYAKEKEYSIDEMGLLALHTKISDRQTIDHAVTILEVKEMMDEAFDHANRKTIGHFFDILFAKRYDEEDMIILRENDFI